MKSNTIFLPSFIALFAMFFLLPVANSQNFLKYLSGGNFTTLYVDDKYIFAQVVYPKTSQYNEPSSDNILMDLNGNQSDCGFDNVEHFGKCGGFGKFDENTYWFLGHDHYNSSAHHRLSLTNLDLCVKFEPDTYPFNCDIAYIGDSTFLNRCTDQLFHYPDMVSTTLTFNPPLDGNKYYLRKTNTFIVPKFKENGFFVLKEYNVEGNLIATDSVSYAGKFNLPQFYRLIRLFNGDWIVSIYSDGNYIETDKIQYKISTTEQFVTAFPLKNNCSEDQNGNFYSTYMVQGTAALVIEKYSATLDTLWQKFKVLPYPIKVGYVSRFVNDSLGNLYVALEVNPSSIVSVLGSTLVYQSYLLKTDSEATDFSTGDIPTPPPIDTTTYPPIDTTTYPPIDTIIPPIGVTIKDSILIYPMPISHGEKIYFKNANFSPTTTYKLLSLDGKTIEIGYILDNSILFTDWDSDFYLLQITDFNEVYNLKLVGFHKRE
jgi:hypothetical protein